MMTQKDWLNMIIPSMQEYIHLKEGVFEYEAQAMSRYYANYLDSIFTSLYEDCLLENIEEYEQVYRIPSYLLQKLKDFRSLIEGFYSTCSNLDNSSLMRRKEWNAIIPLAQECLEGLQKMEAEPKTISADSS